MTTASPGFVRRSRSLFVSILRTPNQVVAGLPDLDATFCIRFGWSCFFFATVATALMQVFFLDVFEELITNPANFDQMKMAFGESFPLSIDEFRTQLAHLGAVSMINLALAPLSAWFFPHLVAGALFVLMQLVSVNKPMPGAYDNMIKLVCLSFGLFVFCAVPIVGPILGNVWWFVFLVRGAGSIFPISMFGRLSATLLTSIILFSIWNETVARLATTLL